MSGRWHSASDICGHLKGRWNGKKGRCRCPVTEHSSDSSPLSITQTRDGRVLVKCFAGCDQRAVIAGLQVAGLWPHGDLTIDPGYPGQWTTKHDSSKSLEDRRAREEALSMWDNAKPAKGTVVEEYLRGRGIRLPSSSDQLRYAPRLKHDICRLVFRAMVARISDDHGFCSVQRTYLDNNKPIKAPIPPDSKGHPGKPKLGRGPQGEGAVRLRMPATDTLGIAEGIETAMSAAQLYSFAVWATLSAHRLAKIEIPRAVRNIIIFGDAGDVGRDQAFKAADEYERRGLHVEVIFPAAHFGAAAGKDYNDVVQAGVA